MSGFSVGSGYSAEAVGFFSWLATSPTSGRAQQYDVLIRSLVNNGVWPRLDALWILAAADAATAVINLKSASNPLTQVNSPAFVADRGFTSDGATSYLTGPNLSIFGGQYALNDCHMGVFCGTNVAESMSDCGSGNSFVRARSSTSNYTTRCNDGSSTNTTGATTSIGHTMASRALSTAYGLYRNGTLLNTVSVTTTSISNQTFQVGAANAAAFSTKQISAAHIGKSMTAAQIGGIWNALSTYLQSVGAPTP